MNRSSLLFNTVGYNYLHKTLEKKWQIRYNVRDIVLEEDL